MKKFGAALLIYLGLASAALAQQLTPPTGAQGVACAFNTVPPTLASGFFGLVQCDAQGRLIVTTNAVANASTNITQFGGNNVVTGTGVSGLGIPRVTVSSDSFPATQAVSATSLPLPTGAATSANQPTNAAQGAAIAGVTGNMAQANATTAAPTYTTATVNPLSMDTSGNLRTSVNVALPAGANAIGSVSSGQYNTTLPTLTNAQTTYPQLDVNGRLLLSPGQLVAAGQYLTTLPTEINGQVNYLQTDINGRLILAPNSPSTAQSVTPLPNFDTGALITHTAASVGVNGADQPNTSGRSINVVVNVTAITGTTPSLTVTLQGKDIASGVYYNILTSAALTAVGTTVLTVFPGATAAANTAANAILPRTWRVITTIAGTTPAVTATVGASVIE